MDIDAVEYLPSRAHLDTWYDVTSGSLDDYPFIPINQICYSRMYTNGCEEIRKMAYFHLDRNACFKDAKLFSTQTTMLLDKTAQHGDYGIYVMREQASSFMRYFPRTVHTAVIENGGFPRSLYSEFNLQAYV